MFDILKVLILIILEVLYEAFNDFYKQVYKMS